MGLRKPLRLALAGLSISAPAMAGDGCAKHFHFERDARLSAEEIARWGKQDYLGFPSDAALSFFEFSAKERPRKNGRSALVFVIASSPTDGPALGGVVWTSSPEAFGEHPARLAAIKGAVQLSLVPDHVLPACPSGLVTACREAARGWPPQLGVTHG